MKVTRDGYPLAVLPAFADLLDGLLEGKEGPAVVSLKDPDYSAEAGGYHPVEIRIEANGRLSYITDFAYCGGPYPELVKELDFDFGLGLFQHFGVDYPIGEGKELFAVFQENFLSYFDWGVFETKVQVER